MLEQHFVTFYSPGSFIHKETMRPIETWDINEATEMAGTITERYGARPFAFQFSTRRQEDNELDSKIVEESSMYYLGGVVLTLDQIVARNRPDDTILISKMRGNGWDRVIENTNSRRVVQPLEAGDTILHPTP